MNEITRCELDEMADTIQHALHQTGYFMGDTLILTVKGKCVTAKFVITDKGEE